MLIRDYNPGDFPQVEALWKETCIYTEERGDTAKIILAITVISPIAKPETFHFALFVGGFIVTILFFALGCLLDTKEVK